MCGPVQPVGFQRGACVSAQISDGVRGCSFEDDAGEHLCQ